MLSCFEYANTSHRFGSFFNHIDHFPQEHFLYITSAGISAAKLVTAPAEKVETPKDAGEKKALAAVESEGEEPAPPAKEENQ